MTEPDDLPALLDVSAAIAWPDTEAEAATHERLSTAGLGADVLGRLGGLAVWLSGVQGVAPPREPQRPRLVVFRADPAASTDIAAVAADVAGVGLRVLDLSAHSSITSVSAGTVATTVATAASTDPATGTVAAGTVAAPICVLSAKAVAAAIRAGARVADEEIDAGTDLLIAAAAGRAAPAADAIVSIMTLVEPVKVVGLDTTLADADWMAWVTDVRDARARGVPHRHDVAELLATVGGPELAALTGFLLRAAARRTPVLIDGVAAGAASLLAREVAPNVVRWWQPGARSTRPAHALALEEYAAVPVLDLAFGVDDGLGAVLAVPLLRAAARLATDLGAAPPQIERTAPQQASTAPLLDPTAPHFGPTEPAT